MIKYMGLLRRREGFTVEAFQRYWRDVHGPIIARTPGLRRYVQSHTLLELYEGERPPAFDGIAEISFDSLETFDQARATPEWRAGDEDILKFVESSKILMVAEVPILDSFPSPRERQFMVKQMSFLTRKDGMSVEAFQRHWREVHAPLIVAELTAMCRYVQSHVLPEAYDREPAPPYDGVPEAWFESLEASRRGLRMRPEGQPNRAIADGANFMKPGPLPMLIAKEIVIVD